MEYIEYLIQKRSIKKHFIHFLKKNHAYEQFMAKFKDYNDRLTVRRNFKHYIELTPPNSLLASAFNWDTMYWAKLSRQWGSELITNDKIIFT